MRKAVLVLFFVCFAMVFDACGGTIVTPNGSGTSSGGSGGGGSDAGMIDSAGESFSIGGTVSGLSGTGLTLQNGSESLSVNANGAFAFATPVASGATYDVTVATQPSTPAQTCTVSNGSGTATANVTNVTVTCTSAAAYTVSGTVMGLAGKGLILQDNSADNLVVSANGVFTFATPVESGSPFDVTVLTQPSEPPQTCTVAGGTGTVGSANVTSVNVACTTKPYTIGGTVTGLAANDAVVLQDNGADNLTLTMNGTFAFATPIASGGSYAVTVLTQPGAPKQTCAIANGSGSVANANVTTVTITCGTSAYTVGGTLVGLASGDSVVLQDNGANNLTLGANGAFTFATPIASGSVYAVTVLTNPSSPAQICAVTSGTGTVINANVTSVVVTCTTTSCPTETTAGCVLNAASNGSTEMGTCAPGYSGSCAYSCSLGSWSPITNTCAGACSSVAGPALPNSISGWTNPGLAFHALQNGTLQSFVFNNQGATDTVQLLDVTVNAVVGSIATPAGNTAYNPTVNWPLVSGHSYQLTAAGTANGRWNDFTAFPMVDAQISVDATWGDGSDQAQYWFSFTNLATCG